MNILHLSDIHFGRNCIEYGIKDTFTEKNRILNELISCVNGIEDGFRPEHIIVTGDIAWQGREKDFNEAIEWFERLLDACKLKGEDISFCAGNHLPALPVRSPNPFVDNR